MDDNNKRQIEFTNWLTNMLGCDINMSDPDIQKGYELVHDFMPPEEYCPIISAFGLECTYISKIHGDALDGLLPNILSRGGVAITFFEHGMHAYDNWTGFYLKDGDIFTFDPYWEHFSGIRLRDLGIRHSGGMWTVFEVKNLCTNGIRNEWLAKFHQAYDNSDIAKLHSLRLEIYRDTIDIVKRGSYYAGKTNVILPEADTMMSETVLYADPGNVSVPKQERATIIEVIAEDSLLAGKKLLEEGYNPAVLNFANRQTPGGGVMGGSGAQEENIFRRSNIFMSLYQFHYHGVQLGIKQRQEQYPMDRNTGGAYSPNVIVFRGLETEGYPLLEHPYVLGIVTVAAMNRPELERPDRIAAHLVEPVRRKIRTIFRIALKHGHDAIVLGAWGCGAFKNPPEHIAELFHSVMNEDEFVNRFKKVVFAIVDRKKIDIKDGKTGNMLVFCKEFS